MKIFPIAWLGVMACLTSAAQGLDFAREVYPILQRACFECHGSHKQEGKLRLDDASVTAHPAVKEIVRRISLPIGDDDAMPRRGARLSAPQVKIVEQWVVEGAKWPADLKPPKHWEYVKPVMPSIPEPKRKDWAVNDIDRFILARLEAENMAPSAPAEPAVLLRRLSLDLRGIPPTPAEVLEFEKDLSSYPLWVERFMNSPDFGVRWARPWLDLARYADSHGFQRDDLRSVWAFRDWVVDALNADMPFDQFTIEQVAGDLLPNPTPSQVIATGFHRCTPTNVEAGTEPEESRINQVIDRVNTTGAVWLGTTLECAQCHDHKYDPFTQKDYYSLLAYFNNTEKEAERTNPKTPGSIQFRGSPFKLSGTVEDTERDNLKAQLASVEKRIKKISGKTEVIAVGTHSEAHALKPSTFETEAGAEYEVLPDHSVLVRGEPADEDVYTFAADLPAGATSALLIEALADESLPGNGPGRGASDRPNFVLTHLEARLINGKEGEDIPLKFASVEASFSQNKFDASGLIDDDKTTAWAINPKFGQSHWVALIPDMPVQVKAGSQLVLRLEFNFGGKRSIGRLRVSGIQGDVASALPKAEEAGAAAQSPMLTKLKKQEWVIRKRLAALVEPVTEVMKELEQPRMSTIFKRGDWQQPSDKVASGTPQVFDAKARGAENRLTLARWLVSEENPLTARVTVNRWWAEIFGRGIVSTVEDFGIKGEPPTHPELLDYLATRFMRQKWSMKQLLKEVFLSATYRQSSAVPKDSVDPDNALLARGPRFRLDAEGIRDNALAIAGLLNPKLGGPSIRPAQPDGLWAKVGGQNYKYETSTGGEQYRRGIYVVLKRGSPYPSMVTFDASARMACVVRRSRSNTPLQALTLLNDPVYVEAARALAARVVKEAPSLALEDQLRYAFRVAVARQPSRVELQALTELYLAQKAARNDASAWEAIGTALLNLDETITKP